MTITRRDFLNGVAIGIGASAIPDWLRAAIAADAPYPPALTGLRGSTDASFAAIHAVAREGGTVDLAALPDRESVDLAIVGAGLAGLSAAWFYRKARPEARILILDNNDDFGGHARRCEFTVDGRHLISYGGSESFSAPNTEWGRDARALIAELGIDLARFEDAKVFHRTLYPDLGLSRAVWFNREAFGVDRLVPGDPIDGRDDDTPGSRPTRRATEAFVRDMPVSDAAKAALRRLFSGKVDYLAGLSADDKAERLEGISYRDYLREHCGLPEDAINAFTKRTHEFFAGGIDVVPAAWAGEVGYPGFKGLGFEGASDGETDLSDAYIHHFPDGNAALARLLVQSLIPAVAPGAAGMDAIVGARFDYGRLDEPDAPVRLRLGATAIALGNEADGVRIGVEHAGGRSAVLAGRAILACNAGAIPWICPSLPERQKQALLQNVRLPLVIAKVAIRNWRSFVALKAHAIGCPMGFFALVKLDYPVSLGGFDFPKSPDEPMVVHMVHVPVEPLEGASHRDQARLGRIKLIETPFETFEAAIRDQLQRILGPGGFLAERDIAAITLNRWAHGYSYEANPLFDDENEFARFAREARKPHGRIALGSSDTGWDAYAHVAIAEAKRAVGDVLKVK
jgi:spermidine dehydrogenase